MTGNGTKVIAAVLGDVGARTPELPEAVRSFTGYVPFAEGVSGHDQDVAAVVTLHLDGDAGAARALDLATLLQAPVEAYLVDERRQWNDFTPPVIAQVSFVHRKPELTRDEFADHWSNVHTGLARTHHPGVCRYTQNVVLEPLTPGAPRHRRDRRAQLPLGDRPAGAVLRLRRGQAGHPGRRARVHRRAPRLAPARAGDPAPGPARGLTYARPP